MQGPLATYPLFFKKSGAKEFKLCRLIGYHRAAFAFPEKREKFGMRLLGKFDFSRKVIKKDVFLLLFASAKSNQKQTEGRRSAAAK